MLFRSEMNCDLSKPWIKTQKVTQLDNQKFIINRTQRYTNAYISYYFLKSIQDKFVFLGTKSEHEIFSSTFNLEIQYLETENFLELAEKMQQFGGGVYNQSFLWHLADAMKLPRQFPGSSSCMLLSLKNFTCFSANIGGKA